jgi:hypothetical protein
VSAGNTLVGADDRSIDGATDRSQADTAPVGDAHHRREREEKGEGLHGRRSGTEDGGTGPHPLRRTSTGTENDDFDKGLDGGRRFREGR